MIPAGRIPDKYHGGVPADHFPKVVRKVGGHRFHDPLLAAMAAVAYANGVVMHAGDGCTDCGEEFATEHFGPTSKGTTDKPWDGSAARFSDEQYRMATAACDPGAGTADGPTVKQGCFLPHHEPEGTINVNGVHAAAQRASSVSGHNSDAVSKAKAHLRSHYAKLKEDPPESIQASVEARAEFARLMAETAAALGIDEAEVEGAPAELVAMFGGLHGSFSGTHSHAHSAYGSQGGDQTHDHSHTHDGDNLHRHSHAATASAAAGTRGTFSADIASSFRRPTPADADGWWEQTLAGLAFVAGATPGQVDPMLGSSWAIKQHGDDWHVLTAAGTWGDGPVASYAEALAVIAQQLAAADGRPVLDQGWKSEMAFEGVSTGDGRFIEPGAIGYRDCPLPLMLQTETEPGHMGAVLAGSINQTGKLGSIAIGSGDFDATDAGRQALQIIDARGRFGVSIDVAEAEGAPQCQTHGQNLDDCDMDCAWELHFTLIKVMGLTMTPFPAFEDAYIELAAQPDSGQATTASGAPDTLTFDGPAGEEFVAELDGVGAGAEAGAAGLAALTAAARGARGRAAVPDVAPPRAWLEPQNFRIGDGRVMKMVNGGYACPLTVEEPDPAHGGLRHVYGHFADRRTCHTGIRDRCQTAPRSRTGYAAFNLRPVMTAEGELVKVGHLTMGVGHAETDPRLSVEDVRAHYDGGPGAIRVVTAAAYDDEFGGYITGYVEPGVTDAQLAEFMACSLSGDWREVWRGRGIELVAVLAGVTSPGFPMAFVAAGLPAGGLTIPREIGTARAGYRNGEPVALVAAGAVRQPFPWERQMAHLADQNAELTRRLETAEKALQPLRPLAAQVLAARLAGDDPLAAFAAPTSADKAVTAALQAVQTALDAAIAAQAKDPDNGTDPDDAVVDSDLQHLKAALTKTIADHAKDAAQDAPEPAAAG